MSQLEMTFDRYEPREIEMPRASSGSRQCEQCGSSYVPGSQGAKQRFCSERCRSDCASQKRYADMQDRIRRISLGEVSEQLAGSEWSNAIGELYRSGHGVTFISKNTGLNKNTIRRELVRLGIYNPSRGALNQQKNAGAGRSERRVAMLPAIRHHAAQALRVLRHGGKVDEYIKHHCPRMHGAVWRELRSSRFYQMLSNRRAIIRSKSYRATVSADFPREEQFEKAVRSDLEAAGFSVSSQHRASAVHRVRVDLCIDEHIGVELKVNGKASAIYEAIGQSTLYRKMLRMIICVPDDLYVQKSGIDAAACAGIPLLRRSELCAHVKKQFL